MRNILSSQVTINSYVLKADISVSDQDGRTALHYAVSQNYLSCVQVIIETDVSFKLCNDFIR